MFTELSHGCHRGLELYLCTTFFIFHSFRLPDTYIMHVRTTHNVLAEAVCCYVLSFVFQCFSLSVTSTYTSIINVLAEAGFCCAAVSESQTRRRIFKKAIPNSTPFLGV